MSFAGENKEEQKKATEDELRDKYQKNYDKNLAMSLLVKLRKETRDKSKIIAGPVAVIVECLGHLISALDNPETPTQHKALIMGAIGYIILPVDLVPDAIPVAGWLDDIASVSGVVALVKMYSTFSLEDLDSYIDGHQ